MSSYFEERMAELKANPPKRKYRWFVDGANPRVRAPKPMVPTGTKKGYIYFVVDGDYVKIGFATNLSSRLTSLRTGNHRKIEIHESFASYREAEKMLHKHFKKDRVRGEWFNLTYDIEEFWDDITDYQGMHTPPGPDADEPGAGIAFLDRMQDTFIPLGHVRKMLDYLNKPWPEGLFGAVAA